MWAIWAENYRRRFQLYSPGVFCPTTRVPIHSTPRRHTGTLVATHARFAQTESQNARSNQTLDPSLDEIPRPHFLHTHRRGGGGGHPPDKRGSHAPSSPPHRGRIPFPAPQQEMMAAKFLPPGCQIPFSPSSGPPVFIGWCSCCPPERSTRGGGSRSCWFPSRASALGVHEELLPATSPTTSPRCCR